MNNEGTGKHLQNGAGNKPEILRDTNTIKSYSPDQDPFSFAILSIILRKATITTYGCPAPSAPRSRYQSPDA